MRSRNDHRRPQRRLREEVKEDEEGNSVEDVGVAAKSVKKAQKVVDLDENQGVAAVMSRLEPDASTTNQTPPPPPLEDERKPPAKPSMSPIAERQAEEDARLKTTSDQNNIQVAAPRFDAADANLNPFLMMMGPQPEAPPPTVDELLNTNTEPDIENEKDVAPPATAATTATTTNTRPDVVVPVPPARATVARRESFDEKASFSLPPEPGTVSRRRGPPRALRPGAEFVRLRAPGMRPSWFEGRGEREEEGAARTETTTPPLPSRASEQVPDDEDVEAPTVEETAALSDDDEVAAEEEDDNSAVVLSGGVAAGAPAAFGSDDGREGVEITAPRRVTEDEEIAGVDWTTARCTPMSARPASFAEETSPTTLMTNDDEMSLVKARKSQLYLLVATYGCGVGFGVGIGMVVWVIYDKTIR